MSIILPRMKSEVTKRPSFATLPMDQVFFNECMRRRRIYSVWKNNVFWFPTFQLPKIAAISACLHEIVLSQ